MRLSRHHWSALASACGWAAGTRMPLSAVTRSAAPARSVVITGRPRDMASATTIPKPSDSVGNTSTSADSYASNRTCRETEPRNSMPLVSEVASRCGSRSWPKTWSRAARPAFRKPPSFQEVVGSFSQAERPCPNHLERADAALGAYPKLLDRRRRTEGDRKDFPGISSSLDMGSRSQ